MEYPMPFKPPEEHGDAVGYGLVFAITYIAAWARIEYRKSMGQEMSATAMIAQMLMSTLASGLMLALALRFQWTMSGTIAACGLSSWCGVFVVMVLERRFIRRIKNEFGVKDDDLKK